MNHENGFDIVVDAFIELKKKPGFEDVKLLATGGSTGADTRFIKNLKKKISKNGLELAVDFHEDFEGQGRFDFFSKVALLSVPVRNGEAFGMYLLEAMASGVPVVQPALGAFPEIAELSGGGIIYPENTPAQLASAWEKLLSNPEKLKALSAKGYEGVKQHFDIGTLSGKMVELYEKLR
jgi:glycosyltransferase involved in cell wall biosynthesis